MKRENGTKFVALLLTAVTATALPSSPVHIRGTLLSLVQSSNVHAPTNRRQAVESPSDCIDRCHRVLDANRSALRARTYGGMVRQLDALCPMQQRTLECAQSCTDFPGKAQLIDQINYVGFLCDRLEAFNRHRVCYSTYLTDNSINKCSGDCAMNLRALSDDEFADPRARLIRSCNLNKCKNECVHNMLYDNCGNDTRSKLEAASIISRWLALDYQTERIATYQSASNTASVPRECNWVYGAVRKPAALTGAALQSSFITILLSLLLFAVILDYQR